MKALQVTEHGSPGEVLEVVEVEEPEPGPNEVRVRVAAASLNFNDIDRCRGNLVSVPTPPPFTLGMDVCGVVDAAGPGAEAWMGKRVNAVTNNALGGIAELACCPATATFETPEVLDDAEGTALTIPYHTTHLGLFERGGLREGETVLVHSAASGLGTAATQLAVAAGAEVIAVVGSAEKGALATQMGAAHVVDHTEGDWADAVFDLTGDRGVDVCCDLAGGSFVAPSWRVTARGGRYLAIGYADDDQNGMTGQPLRMASIGNISIVGVLCAYVDDLDPGMRRFGFNPMPREVGDRVHADLVRLVAEGKVRPHVGRRVSMEEAGAALDEHEARRSVGRTVVEIS
jgi:NADPH2:quinone reductase